MAAVDDWTPPFRRPEIAARLIDYAERCDGAGNAAAAVVLRVAAGFVLDPAPDPDAGHAERPLSCETCGEPLPAPSATGRPRRYCPGRRCRDAARSRAEPRAKLAGAIVDGN